MEVSWIALIYQTVVWSSVAAVFGFILMRQLTIYPGKHSISYILPCLLFSYSVVACMMFLLRTDYSSYVIIASFVTVLIWLHSMQMRFHFIFIAMRCGQDFQDGRKLCKGMWAKLMLQP